MPITVQASLRVRKLALQSNRSYGYAFHSRAAFSNTSPHVLPGGEMIAPRFESTKDFAKKRNNLVYFRLSKMLCGFKDQVRTRPSGGTCGLGPAPASVILVRNAGEHVQYLSLSAFICGPIFMSTELSHTHLQIRSPPVVVKPCVQATSIEPGLHRGEQSRNWRNNQPRHP